MRLMPTNGGNAMVDDQDFYWLLAYKWRLSVDGYVEQIKRDGAIITRVRMHLLIAAKMGISGECIDHIDGNILNNQRSNLRAATIQQNLWNRKGNANSLLGVKGVAMSGKKFRAKIMVSGVYISLGTYCTIIEAKEAYDKAAKKHFGEFYHE